jgi:hypothetical protein
MDWSPGARLTKPLKDATLALVTTAGLHLPTQLPFDFKVRGGDFSFREILHDVDVPDLQISHPHREVAESEDLDGLASRYTTAVLLGGSMLAGRRGARGGRSPRTLLEVFEEAEEFQRAARVLLNLHFEDGRILKFHLVA